MAERRKTYQHARPSGSSAPDVPEPSYAERARTLVHVGRVGTLATLSRKHPGSPFASVAPYGLDEKGSPAFLVSTMAMHTQNLLESPRASLLVADEAGASDPLGSGRVTLMGSVTRTPESELEAVRERYLARHDNARYWVDFEDFGFFSMEVLDLYFVGGFGVMGWVAADDYLAAEPDPLADAAAGILDHMNEDHVEALLLLAKHDGGLEGEDAKMTAVDRLGFHARVVTPDGMRGLRIPFLREARTPDEVRRVLVEMVEEARRARSS